MSVKFYQITSQKLYDQTNALVLLDVVQTGQTCGASSVHGYLFTKWHSIWMALKACTFVSVVCIQQVVDNFCLFDSLLQGKTVRKSIPLFWKQILNHSEYWSEQHGYVSSSSAWQVWGLEMQTEQHTDGWALVGTWEKGMCFGLQMPILYLKCYHSRANPQTSTK